MFGSPNSQGQLAGLVSQLLNQPSEGGAPNAGNAALAESSLNLARSLSALSDSVAAGSSGASQQDLSTLLMLGSIMATAIRNPNGEVGGGGDAEAGVVPAPVAAADEMA
jgi:hypothetical protein